ncbi:hypothetical protein FNG32_23825 [Salmonella enterica]|nr:hypothetical protein [Salmonella enterica]
MNIPIRENVSLICYLRRQLRTVPIIITQNRFFFSDRVVAEFFGFIWMQSYDTLLFGYPDVSLLECVTKNSFAGTFAAGIVCRDDANIPDIILDEWLEYRLQLLIGSKKMAEIALNCFKKNIPVAEISTLRSCSKQLIYHYRCRVEHKLNIGNHHNDIIQSLLVKGGTSPHPACQGCQWNVGQCPLNAYCVKVNIYD